jgi:phytoene dehydrogenase-like protein
MSDADYIVVGSGINALVAAAMLGRKGRKVLVLERNDRIGGCLRTEEITVPGFVHEVMATTIVLFLLSPAYAALGKDLRARGLEIAGTDTPTAALLPDGRAAVFSTDRASNLAMFDELAEGEGARFGRVMDNMGANAPFVFSLLGGSLWSGGMLWTVLKETWRRGPRALAAFLGEALETARAHLETTYQSEVAQALWAPWVLHTGLGPESAYSAQMAKVIAFAIEAAGCPIVKGRAHNSSAPSASSLRIKAAADDRRRGGSDHA